MKPQRFALLSHTLPPAPSGQAVILYRILSGLDPKEYYVVSREAYERNGSQEAFLPVEYFDLVPPRWLQVLTKIRLPAPLHDLVNIVIMVCWRTYRLVQIGWANPIRAIVACTGDIADIPAGFFSSRILQIDFYAYIFDDYVYQWTGLYRFLARLISPWIFSMSAGVIGPNENICNEYSHRYACNCVLVRNPCSIEELNAQVCDNWPNEAGKIKIVYTGALYHANFDCFHNLLQAMNSLPEYPLELHIFTAQTPEQLARHGILGEKLFVHSHVPYNEILEEQRKADILFLPLAFESPIPEVIRTSAPGKLGEYLASGRPVLAHVPADSFIAYYFKRYECGLLVEQNDVDKLAVAMRKLVTDPANYSKMIDNARRQASLDFSPEKAQNRLSEFLQLETNLQ